MKAVQQTYSALFDAYPGPIFQIDVDPGSSLSSNCVDPQAFLSGSKVCIWPHADPDPGVTNVLKTCL